MEWITRSCYIGKGGGEGNQFLKDCFNERILSVERHAFCKRKTALKSGHRKENLTLKTGPANL